MGYRNTLGVLLIRFLSSLATGRCDDRSPGNQRTDPQQQCRVCKAVACNECISHTAQPPGTQRPMRMCAACYTLTNQASA
jgi:hypothetical protein